MEPYKGAVKVGGKEIPWETSFGQDTRFSCQRCALCCIGSAIELTEKEASRLENAGHKDFLRRFQPGIPGMPSARIRLMKDGKCHFQGRGDKCIVYPLRPCTCLSYPFKVVFAGGKAYIDLSWACLSVLSEKPPKKNDADFEEIVKANVLGGFHEKGFDQDRSLDTNWFDKALQAWKSQDPWDILKNLGEKDWKEFIHSSIRRQVSNQVQGGISIGRGLKSSQYYTDYFYGDSFVFEYPKRKVKVNPLKLRRKPLTQEAKALLLRYLGYIWRRKYVQLDFLDFCKQITRLSGEVPIEAVQKRITRIMLSRLVFSLHLISEKNKHKTIERDDVAESIILLDTPFFRMVFENSFEVASQLAGQN